MIKKLVILTTITSASAAVAMHSTVCHDPQIGTFPVHLNSLELLNCKSDSPSDSANRAALSQCVLPSFNSSIHSSATIDNSTIYRSVTIVVLPPKTVESLSINHDLVKSDVAINYQLKTQPNNSLYFLAPFAMYLASLLKTN